ncbi:E3 ubiquitin-protein ligase RSP5-like [Harmonia axyridis]|uniref:E3 ubiquitin-protein ligase RSP5-like n=1 Tax=Harmonia axyridis TaxID=115357 RepID=UPI001E278ECB|nr:E3 ubiquitin-protein ligase RSP5-like [Harmonia axyridis]
MDDYIENVKHALLYTGTRRQFNALKNAFDSLVPLHKLRMFHPEELQTLLCGDDNDIMQWTVDNLRKNVKLEGFTVEDDDIQNLFSELSDASKESRSNFLEFVTGCTRLPVGGFEDLQPPLRIVRTTAGWPSAQTCYHQLNLPSGMTKEQISKFMIEIVPEALGFFGLA